jgi:acyl-CoA thioester hydrolase
MTRQRPLYVDLPITVKTYDIDFMGVVSNIAYVRWMEDLRLRFLEVHYPLEKLLSDLVAPIIARTQIEYRRPIRIQDRVTGSMWMEKSDPSGWMASMEFVVNGRQAAIAKQGGVFIDITTMKPADPPEGLQKKYQEAMQQSR